MALFRIYGTMTISVSTVVDASTKKKALEIAAERGVIRLCCQCSGGNDQEEWVTSGELDDEPKILEAKKEDE